MRTPYWPYFSHFNHGEPWVQTNTEPRSTPGTPLVTDAFVLWVKRSKVKAESDVRDYSRTRIESQASQPLPQLPFVIQVHSGGQERVGSWTSSRPDERRDKHLRSMASQWGYCPLTHLPDTPRRRALQEPLVLLADSWLWSDRIQSIWHRWPFSLLEPLPPPGVCCPYLLVPVLLPTQLFLLHSFCFLPHKDRFLLVFTPPPAVISFIAIYIWVIPKLLSQVPSSLPSFRFLSSMDTLTSPTGTLAGAQSNEVQLGSFLFLLNLLLLPFFPASGCSNHPPLYLQS